ncbi:PREDICTED: olfactory receptor 11H6-like [Galeopterus variegatus]|uniref:Olfactory receptor 11H6-like n=1 Tax=Galeopterus variegatus TaxID=482537 RepID=A0ABM0S8I0_GALVR|nr:PREDICTED: olfactory receptor 11H6-like [Galeopterus variegatus]
MERVNRTLVTEFVFLKFSSSPRLQLLFFSLFFLVYLLSLVGNALIVLVVVLDRRLHTPMYFFVCNLSLVELWYTTVTVPKMLANFLSSPGDHLSSQLHHAGIISVPSCITQYYFFFSLAATELFILTTMAFDRYAAVYTYAIQVVGYAFSTVIILGALFFTMASYAQILATVLAMSSAAAQRKAFSTCTAHLSVVTIYFGTLIFMYVRPAVKYESNINKIVAIVYSVITPLLNPLIYTLRNKDVREALKVLVFQIQRVCYPSKETR